MCLGHLCILSLGVGNWVGISHNEMVARFKVSETDHLNHALFLELITTVKILFRIYFSQLSTIKVVYFDRFHFISFVRYRANKIWNELLILL